MLKKWSSVTINMGVDEAMWSPKRVRQGSDPAHGTDLSTSAGRQGHFLLSCIALSQAISEFAPGVQNGYLRFCIALRTYGIDFVRDRAYLLVFRTEPIRGCSLWFETWTLTLREEHRLRVFENKVLKKIFGSKRDEVTGEWRKLHNTELRALYSSPDIIMNIKSRRLRWAGHVARIGESRNSYRMLVGRPAGERCLGRPRRRWEDNIKMDLRKVGYDDREWINLAQDRDQ
ncbi:hypothetical protein ANN_16358 [Periplaneta americana]|uniref:Uncharacterized protein n=1 Tax=Periplaneta americana TaxID=6978 RepID=A0ABQ8SIS3_PERAM|nr:hypothetical protein ANN_16358 [Periplaneta americana]